MFIYNRLRTYFIISNILLNFIISKLYFSEYLKQTKRISLDIISSGSGRIIYFPIENNTPKFLLINVPLFFLFSIKSILLSFF